MKCYVVPCLMVLPLVFGAGPHALAQTPSADAPPQSQPAPSQAPDPLVDALLDQLQAKARTIVTLRARVRYDRIQALQGEEQRRFGSLIFIAGPPARFAVHFDRLIADDLPRRQDQWWIYDGQWLVERNDDKKQFFKRQIAPPNAPVNQADPLSLGEGPFIIPLKADKQLMLDRFEVALLAPAEGDPANSVHLLLKPLPGRNIEFQTVDLWYDRDTLLPVRGRTTQSSGDEQVFHLLDAQLNSGVKPGEINTKEPAERGWHIEITPWERN